MSRVASPFTGLRYGVVRVTREWEMARSSFYYRREIAAQPGRVLGRRGPKTAWSDAALLEKIREVIRRLSILRRGPADQTEEEEKPTPACTCRRCSWTANHPCPGMRGLGMTSA
jgi:hypothetical protein